MTTKTKDEFSVSESQYTRTRNRVKGLEDRVDKIEAVIEQHMGVPIDQLNADGESQEPGLNPNEPNTESDLSTPSTP